MATQAIHPSVDADEGLSIPAPSTVESLTRGEIDVQVATAKRYPRSLTTFKTRALEMATLDQETAESCIYALPRDGKTIEGPSARLAEILASAYGHMRIEGRPVGEDGQFITARGTAWDIQSNVLIAFETKRRITDKNGRRYKDDMIGVTANAATSIAIRNAILKVIPKAFWDPIYRACRKTAVGDSTTLANRRAAMLEYFVKLGASQARVFGLLGVTGLDDITLDHLATLKGIATAIKEGDTSVDEAFATAPEPPRVARLSETRPASPSGGEAPTGVPASASTVPQRVSLQGRVAAVDQVDGTYFVRLDGAAGELVAVPREADAAELEKFVGTDHHVRLDCHEVGDGLVLQTFAIAD